MSKQKRVTLAPSYFEKFSCIGPQCEDTCCQGWKVSIDHKTYKKYKNLTDKKVSERIKTHIKRVRSNANEQNYAVIVMNEENMCPFLNENKLCEIQYHYGEGYLSNVCSMYPRAMNMVDTTIEKSLTLSCPEVARLALLNPDGIEFNEGLEEMENRVLISNQLKTDNISHPTLKYLWDFRIFIIELLQNRSYKLEDRLIILGIFLDKAQQSIDEKRYDDLPQLIASYRNLVESGMLRESLKEIPTSYEIQLQLSKYLVDLRVSLGVNQPVYLQCVQETLEGIQFADNKSISELSQSYQEAFQMYYVPFMTSHEYILENYLVHYVFRYLFPLGSDPERLYDEYVRLVLHFAMIKLHLIGMAGFHKQIFGLDHVIRAIYSFGRVVEHAPLYLIRLTEMLHKRDQTSLAHMAILIKN